jgi:hypothetical protein
MKHNLVSRIANLSIWAYSEYQRVKDLSYEEQCLSPINTIYPGIIDKFKEGKSFLEIITNDNPEDTLNRLYLYESIIYSNM